MGGLAAAPDAEFHQGDSERTPIDFFTPLVPAERLHPTFNILTSQERYSPARDLIAAMMRFHEDADGNFIEQFQTTGFDPRLWELRSEEHTSELQSLMRISYAVFCLKKKNKNINISKTKLTK